MPQDEGLKGFFDDPPKKDPPKKKKDRFADTLLAGKIVGEYFEDYEASKKEIRPDTGLSDFIKGFSLSDSFVRTSGAGLGGEKRAAFRQYKEPVPKTGSVRFGVDTPTGIGALDRLAMQREKDRKDSILGQFYEAAEYFLPTRREDLRPRERAILGELRDFEKRTGLTPAGLIQTNIADKDPTKSIDRRFILPLHSGRYVSDDELVESEIMSVARRNLREERSKKDREPKPPVRAGRAARIAGADLVGARRFTPKQTEEDYEVKQKMVTAKQVERRRQKGESPAMEGIGVVNEVNLLLNPMAAVLGAIEHVAQIVRDKSRDNKDDPRFFDSQVDKLTGLTGMQNVGKTVVDIFKPAPVYKMVNGKRVDVSKSGGEVFLDGLLERLDNPFKILDDINLYKMGDRAPDDWFQQSLLNLPMDAAATIFGRYLIPIMVLKGAMGTGTAAEKASALYETIAEAGEMFTGAFIPGEVENVLKESPFGVFAQMRDVQNILKSKTQAASRSAEAKREYDELGPEIARVAEEQVDAVRKFESRAKKVDKFEDEFSDIAGIRLPEARREATKFADMSTAADASKKADAEVARLERQLKQADADIETAMREKRLAKEDLENLRATREQNKVLRGSLNRLRGSWSRYRKSIKELEALKSQGAKLDRRARAKTASKLFDEVEAKRAEVAQLEQQADFKADKRLAEFRRARSARDIYEARSILASKLRVFENRLRVRNDLITSGPNLRASLKDAKQRQADAIAKVERLEGLLSGSSVTEDAQRGLMQKIGRARTEAQRLTDQVDSIQKRLESPSKGRATDKQIKSADAALEDAFIALDAAYKGLSEIGRETDFGKDLIGALQPLLAKARAAIESEPRFTVARRDTQQPSGAARDLLDQATARADEMSGGRSIRQVKEGIISARQASRSAKKDLPKAYAELEALEAKLRRADEEYYRRTGADVMASRGERFDAKVEGAISELESAAADIQRLYPQVMQAAQPFSQIGGGVVGLFDSPSGRIGTSDLNVIKEAIRRSRDIINSTDAPMLSDQFIAAEKALQGPVERAIGFGSQAVSAIKNNASTAAEIRSRYLRAKELEKRALEARKEATVKLKGEFVAPAGTAYFVNLGPQRQGTYKRPASIGSRKRRQLKKPDKEAGTVRTEGEISQAREAAEAMRQLSEVKYDERMAQAKRAGEQVMPLTTRKIELQEVDIPESRKTARTEALAAANVHNTMKFLEAKDKALRAEIDKAQYGAGLKDPVSELGEFVAVDLLPLVFGGGTASPAQYFSIGLRALRMLEEIGIRKVRERAGSKLEADPEATMLGPFKAESVLKATDSIRHLLRAPSSRLAERYLHHAYETAYQRDRDVLDLQKAVNELDPSIVPTANMYLHMEHSNGSQVKLPESKLPVFNADETQSLIKYERNEVPGYGGGTGEYKLTEKGQEVVSMGSGKDAQRLNEMLDVMNRHMMPVTDKLTAASQQAADLGLIYNPSAGRPLWFTQTYQTGFLGRLRRKQNEMLRRARKDYPELFGENPDAVLKDLEMSALRKSVTTNRVAQAIRRGAGSPASAAGKAGGLGDAIGQDSSRIRANILRRASKKWETAETARVQAETQRRIGQGESPDSFTVERKENPYSIENREAAGLVSDIHREMSAGVSRFMGVIREHNLYRQIARDKEISLTRKEWENLPPERRAEFEAVVLEKGKEFMPGPKGQTPTALGELNGILERVVDPDTGKVIANKWRKRNADEQLFVKRDVLKEMQMARKYAQDMQGLMPELVRMWKVGKTALSPMTLLRNVYTNMFVFAPMDGVSPFNPANWKYYQKVLKDLSAPAGKRSKDFDTAFKSGVFRGNQSRVELAGDVHGLLPGIGGIQTAEQFLSAMTSAAFGKGIKMTPEIAVRMYSAADDIFRGASAYKKYDQIRKDGRYVGRQEAKAIADESRKNYVDYEDVNGLVQVLRAPSGSGTAFALFGKPFIAFTAGAIPLMQRWYDQNPRKAMIYHYLMDQITDENMTDAGLDPATEQFMLAMMPGFKRGYAALLQALTPFNLENPEKETAFGLDEIRKYAGTDWVNPMSFLFPDSDIFSELPVINYASKILTGESPVLGPLRDALTQMDSFRRAPLFSELASSGEARTRIWQLFLDSYLPSWMPSLTSTLGIRFTPDLPGEAELKAGSMLKQFDEAEQGKLSRLGLPITTDQAFLRAIGLQVNQNDATGALSNMSRLLNSKISYLEKSFENNIGKDRDVIKNTPELAEQQERFIARRMEPLLRDMKAVVDPVVRGGGETESGPEFYLESELPEELKGVLPTEPGAVYAEKQKGLSGNPMLRLFSRATDIINAEQDPLRKAAIIREMSSEIGSIKSGMREFETERKLRRERDAGNWFSDITSGQ